MNINLGNDQYYLIKVPASCKEKKFLYVPMKRVTSPKVKNGKKVSKEEALMEQFKNNRSQSFINSIDKIKDLEYRNDIGNSYLYAAAEGCNYYAVKALLDRGFSPNDVNKYQAYSGRAAALSDHFFAVDVFCLFLERGLDLDLPTFRGTIRSDIMEYGTEAVKKVLCTYDSEHIIPQFDRAKRDSEFIAHTQKVLEEERLREEKRRLERIEKTKTELGEDSKFIEEAFKIREQSKDYPHDENDILHYAKREHQFKDSIAEMLTEIEQKNNYLHYDSVVRDYTIIGSLAWTYRRNIKDSKKFFYEKSLYHIEMLNNSNYFEKYRSAGDVSFASYKCMFYAVLSGNYEVAKEIAGLIKQSDKDVPCDVGVGNVLKNLILGNDEEVKKWLEKCDSHKLVNTHVSKLDIKAMRGIFLKDEEMFNEGLKDILKYHEKCVKAELTILDDFPHSALALAMIGKRKSMNVTVKHPLFSEEYIEDCDIDYQDIKANLRVFEIKEQLSEDLDTESLHDEEDDFEPGALIKVSVAVDKLEFICKKLTYPNVKIEMIAFYENDEKFRDCDSYRFDQYMGQYYLYKTVDIRSI